MFKQKQLQLYNSLQVTEQYKQHHNTTTTTINQYNNSAYHIYIIYINIFNNNNIYS